MKKILSTLLAGILLLSMLPATAFAAGCAITVTGQANSSTVTVTVTNLEPRRYYFGAVQQNGTILSLFDGTAGQDGVLTASVNIGKIPTKDEQLEIGISENVAGGQSEKQSVKVEVSGTATPGDDGDPDPEKPGTDEPGTDTPGTDEPGTDTPGTGTPGTDKPGTDTPGTDTPGTDEPGTDTPGTDKPGTDTPGTDKPGTDTPSTDKPTTPLVPTTTYWISTYQNNCGSISVASSARAGDTVWARLYPKSGYDADGLTVTDSTGRVLDVYHQGSGRYTFTMPASSVWLDAIFVSSYVPRPSYTYTTPASASTATQAGTASASYNTGSAFYRDVSRNAWYYDAVQYVYRYDLMSGTGSGYFSPNQPTTRAMVVTILYNMAGRPTPAGGRFDDVSPDAWYADAVLWAARNKIASGYGGFFRPNEDVTREEMALMVYNYAKLTGCDVSAQSGLTTFSDSGRISAQTLKAVRWANAAGLLNGVNGGRLDPRGLVTRAQIASILMNFREYTAY